MYCKNINLNTISIKSSTRYFVVGKLNKHSQPLGRPREMSSPRAPFILELVPRPLCGANDKLTEILF